MDLALMQECFTKLGASLVDCIERSWFDESVIQYEAARLEHHPVVLACFFEGEDHSQAGIQIVCCKGGDVFLRYLQGEIPLADFEFAAVFARDWKAAWALNAALLRRTSPLRLVQ